MNSWTPSAALIAYSDTSNVPTFSQPGALIVAGRSNNADPKFAVAKASGALVVPYRNWIELPGAPAQGDDADFYAGAESYLWKYPTPGARQNYMDPVTGLATRLLDITVGSPWVEIVLARVEALLRSGKWNGLYSDLAGGKLWSTLAAFDTWPQSEKDAWTLGVIQVARRLDALRRQIDPSMILINNNTWDRGDSVGFAGEQYSSPCMEHSAFNAYHQTYIAKPFGGPGIRRAAMVISNPGDGSKWAGIEGPVWITEQTTAQYTKGSYLPCIPIKRTDFTRQP